MCVRARVCVSVCVCACVCHHTCLTLREAWGMHKHTHTHTHTCNGLWEMAERTPHISLLRHIPNEVGVDKTTTVHVWAMDVDSKTIPITELLLESSHDHIHCPKITLFFLWPYPLPKDLTLFFLPELNWEEAWQKSALHTCRVGQTHRYTVNIRYFW